MLINLNLIFLVTTLYAVYHIHRTYSSNDDYFKKIKSILETNLSDHRISEYLSCKGRCRVTSSETFKYCSCTARCVVYRNCCEDVVTECPAVVAEGIKHIGHMMEVQVECLELPHIMAVASCPNQTNFTKKLINKDSLFDIMNNVPVTDVDTSIVYANMDMFKCNSPNASKSGLGWTIKIHHSVMFLDKMISRIEHYIFSKPSYYYNTDSFSIFDSCLPHGVSLCNNSVSLQRLCHSFEPNVLLQKLVYNYTLCGACSVDLSTFSLHDFLDDKFERSVTIEPETNLMRADKLPWTDAKCDMSNNATLSGLMCQLVKCNTPLGYYLHEDGSCRRFSLLSIGYQNDLWLLNQDEYYSLLNYMMYYLARYLDVIPLGAVKPLCLLYSTQLQQNFSIATFVLDFNSSALEDYVYIKYKDELSILASEIRAIIEYKITQINKSNTGFKLINDFIGQQWMEIETNNTKSGQVVFNWCSCPKLNFSLFTLSENKNMLCLYRMMPYVGAHIDDCFQVDVGLLRCYEEVTQVVFESQHSSSLAKHSYVNLPLLFAQFLVAFLSLIS